MPKSLWSGLLAGLLAVLSVCPSFAQPQRDRRAPPRSEISELDPQSASRYQLALSYIQGAQFNRAIVLLEDLWADYPTFQFLFDKLLDSYEAVKRYPEAIELLETGIKYSVDTGTELQAERARLLLLSGDEVAAYQAWNDILDAAGATEVAYRHVYASLIQVRLLDRAIEVLLRGRRVLDREDLFRSELAELYTFTGHHQEAMQEYLELVLTNGRQVNFVRGRLMRALEQDGALDAAIAATEAQVAVAPDVTALRELLAWLHIEANDYESAFAHTLVLDQQSGSDGQLTQQFAVRAAEGGAYAIAQRAFQSVLDRRPDDDLGLEAQLGLANMFRLQGEALRERAEDAPYHLRALEAYDALLSAYPDHPRRPEILTRIGAIQQDVIRDEAAASEMLTAVIEQFPATPLALNARFDLGRLALAGGALDEARRIFVYVASVAAGEMRLRADLELAQIDIYQGRLLEAQNRLARLNTDTESEVANDAIELRVLLLENAGPDSLDLPLRAYGSTLLLLRQYKFAEASEAADDFLAEWGWHPIADDMRFLRARALRDAGDVLAAHQAFGEFPLLHPESPFCDRSLFTYAEMFEEELGNPASALASYAELLTRYPGSLLVNESRARIRRLREAGT